MTEMMNFMFCIFYHNKEVAEGRQGIIAGQTRAIASLVQLEKSALGKSRGINFRRKGSRKYCREADKWVYLMIEK